MDTNKYLNELHVGKMVILRGYYPGCHYGKCVNVGDNGNVVTLEKSRRMWGWEGAKTLSNIANTGTDNANECRFPAETLPVTVIGVCEILQVRDKAVKNLKKIPNWE